MRSVPYRLFIYLMMLGASFVILGVTGYRAVTSVDDAYSAIIDKRLPMLNLVRNISSMSNRGWQALDELVVDRVPSRLPVTREEMASCRNLNDRNLARLKQLINDDVKGRMLFEKMMAARENSRQQTERLLASVVDPQVDNNTLLIKRAPVLESFNVYLKAQDALGVYVENQSAMDSALATDLTQTMLRYCTLFALWPILLGLAFVGYGVLSTALIFLSKNHKAEDAAARPGPG